VRDFQREIGFEGVSSTIFRQDSKPRVELGSSRAVQCHWRSASDRQRLKPSFSKVHSARAKVLGCLTRSEAKNMSQAPNSMLSRYVV
jgi:hypothetical protein